MMNCVRTLIHSIVVCALLFSSLPFFPEVTRAAAPAVPAKLTALVAASTFDAGPDGWQYFGDALGITFNASGGNPGGYVSASDASLGVSWYFSAPPKFLGDQSAAYGGTLTFDLKQSDTTNPYDDADVVLVGAGITLTLNTPYNPGKSWTSYSVRLHEGAGWQVGSLAGPLATASQLQQVLSSLASLRIRGEYHVGSDTGGLDNVILRAGPAPCELTVRTFAQSPDVAIPDIGTITDTVNVGVFASFPYIWDVNVSTFVTHSYSIELDVFLRSPAGTVVTLTTANGSVLDDVFNGTLWDDEALLPVTDAPYANNFTATPLVPEAKFQRFSGENPVGPWSLIVKDRGANGSGRLNQWSLMLTLCAAPPALLNTTTMVYPLGPTNIPDGGAINSGMTRSDLGSFVCGITLTTVITHSYFSEVEMILRAPSGVTTTISTNAFLEQSTVFSGTVWTDRSPVTVSDLPFASGQAPRLAPEGALSRFIGENANGTWQLLIRDEETDNLSGRLLGWSITIATCATNRVLLPVVVR